MATQTKTNKTKSKRTTKRTQPQQPKGFDRNTFTEKFDTKFDTTSGVLLKWASNANLIKGERVSSPSPETKNGDGTPRKVSRLVYTPTKVKAKVMPGKGRVKFSQNDFCAHYELRQDAASKIVIFLCERGVLKKFPREQWGDSKRPVAIYQQIAELNGSVFCP